ncbi:hybrid sensor histidine kinase/response regulator [Paenibacillus sp. SYP-B4298]|uniref:hybrid sensor histidine kinase/response regulator n=1 Tax=Paenibacillus sp. SYP-B4298 TaxID=2996034 RepID=UPI0022DDD582|nr:ATP-binding protein [Paenibacillus sp. SYP-B4298]
MKSIEDFAKRYGPLILLLVIVVVALSTVLYPAVTRMMYQPDPIIKQGVLDLTQWDAQQDGRVKLVGYWAFYWKQLLESSGTSGLEEASAAPDGYFKVPDVWNNYRIDGERLPGQGFATYRLTVKLGEASRNRELALSIPSISTAYRVIIDGKERAAGGQVARTSDEAKAAYVPQYISFRPTASQFDIYVQVSNHVYARGGIWYDLELGSTEDVAQASGIKFALDMIIMGAAFMIGMHHLVIFLFRPANRSALYFSLCCLIATLRILVVDQNYISLLFSDIPFRVLIMLEYFTFYAGVMLIALFIRELYPTHFAWRHIRIIVVVCLLALLTVIATPLEEYTGYIRLFNYFSLLCCLYYTSGIFRAAIRRRQGATLQVFGMCLFMVAMVHDIFYNASIIHLINSQLVPFGMFIFIFIEAANMARRFSSAYRTIEDMSAQLIAKDRIKDEFLANTSHELKTPIHGVLNLSQAVLDGAGGRLTAGEQDNLQAVVSVSRRLSHLINDILDWSMLKNGEITLRRKPVELRPLLAVTMEMFRYLHMGKPVELIDALPEHLPAVDADEDRLMQVMYNLIGNAIKFTDKGEVRITATERHGFIEISVSDTGIGIPATQLGSIFDSFEQTDRKIAAEYGGVGLGLSITKRLVELHGGRITVQSSEGAGSVFTFSLPAVRSMRLPAQQESDEGALEPRRMLSWSRRVQLAKEGEPDTADLDNIRYADQASEQGSDEYTILVADDDGVNRQVLSSLLALDNCKVVAVSDGNEALAALHSERFDLAIVDLMMPGKSGYEVTEAIRERYSLAELPVLLLTVRNQPQDIVAAFKAGVNDFLNKPVEPGELRARIRTLLDLKSSVSDKVNIEMAFLQAQIKPHYLFNVLTTILSISYTDLAKAQELLGSFSRYLRGSFDFQNKDKLVPLDKELQLVEAYLEIEQARFGSRLKTEVDVTASTSWLIPPLVIQPLVENAVRHGAMGRMLGGIVKLTVRSEQSDIVVTIADDGRGMPQERLDAIRERRSLKGGVGLMNIDSRLRHIYGTGLQIASCEEEGTTITFRIPYRSA